MIPPNLTQIGNSVDADPDRDVLARLKLAKGDTVFLTDAAHSGHLSPDAPTLEEQLKAGREFMHEFRDAFHQLAK